MSVIRSLFRYRGAEPIEIPEALEASLRGELLEAPLQELYDEVHKEAQSDRGSFVWIKMQDPSRAELESIQRIFEIPEMQIEETLDHRQRPNLEVDLPNVFLILKELRYVEASSDVETGQVAVFIGRGYAISVRYGDAAPGSSRERLSKEPELVQFGPASVLFAVCDVIVDGYLSISHELDHDVAEIEEAVFADDIDRLSEVIYRLKRENLELRRALSPLKLADASMKRGSKSGVPEPLRPYFSDLVDHILQAYELTDARDKLLMALLMTVNSQQELQQSRDMRRISAYAAIIAVPTAIAGIYGMNFSNMPGLTDELGFTIVMTLMIGACIGLYIAFKRSGWL